MHLARRLFAGCGLWLAFVAGLRAWPGIEWSSVPGDVESGQSYFVEAHGWDDEGNLTRVNVWRQWTPYAFAGGGDGWNGWSGNPSSDNGEAWIEYEAESYDDYNGRSSGVTYQTVHVNRPNSVPTIEWSSAPTEVESGQQYFVEAHGYDPDGNLATVSVWRDDSPYAFAGGGDGTNGWSGNPSTDTGERYITYKAQAGDGKGAYSDFIYLTVHIKPANQAPSVWWTIQPGYVDRGSRYRIRADAHDPDNNMTGVHIYKEWAPFAFALNGNQTDAYSDNPDIADGPAGSAITYMAEAHDSMGAQSDYIYQTVYITNHQPDSGWSPWPDQTVYINQEYNITASASDPDDNLDRMTVTWWAWEQFPDGSSANHWSDAAFDTAYSSGGGSLSRTYTLRGGKPFKWQYNFIAIAYDSMGACNWPWLGTQTRVFLDNRDPKPPTLVSTQTRIGLGQTVLLSGDGTDDDENATNQWLWYQGPNDGSSEWHQLAVSQYVDGTGHTVANYSFTPTQLGTYHFKTRVDDPYASTVDIIVDVLVEDQTPPDPQTNFRATETHSTWAYFMWDLSPAPDVAEQHLYWQPSGGGATTDVALGINVAGVSITGFSPGNSYHVYMKARDGAGNYSAASNSVDITTPYEPPTITSQPQSQCVLTGQSVTLSVGASGYPTPTYQWFKKNVAITGATNSTYTIASAKRANAGVYTVTVSNTGGSVTSNPALLSVGIPGDSDGDGMPDAWEQQYGLNPYRMDDALLDPDGDGITNVAEYNLGFSPIAYNAGTSTLGGSIPAGWPNQGDSSNTSAVGITTGELNVDHSGALTYSVPIWVTPGTAGMQPQLSLNYSSQGGPGLAGFGWSLSGASQISRGPATRAVDGFIHGVDFTSGDRFYLDGQRLIAISGTDGADGTEYRTEIDGFTKVISHGATGSGPAWFEAWTKAGLIIEFGNTTDSAFDPTGSSGVLTWSVSKIRDTKGNYMTFTYSEDVNVGKQLLSRIDYTGNTAAAKQPYASVRFEYEIRSDSSSGYRAGCLVSSTDRLKSIKSYYGETVARTYTLNYTASGPTSRSLLTSLAETGKDGTSYPNLTFQYESNTPGWESKSSAPWIPPTATVTLQGYNGRPTQYGTGFVDLNGDGRPDFVQYYWDGSTSPGTSIQHAWLNTPSAWVPVEDPMGTDYRPPFALGYWNNHDTSARFADLDGDGRVDILWHHVTGDDVHESGAYRNTGSGWASMPGFAPPFALAYDKDTSPRGVNLIDLNGDGRVDLIANGSGNVRLNNGSGWDPASQWSAPCDLARGAAFIDVNGDGLPDIVQRWSGDNQVIESVHINNGNGWTSYYSGSAEFARYLPPTPLNSSNPDYGSNAPRGTEFVDLNGDGLVDLIARNDGAGNLITPTAWFNTGKGWVQATNYVPSGTAFPELRHDHESRGVAFMDLNGDGSPDMVRAQVGQTSTVYYNNGHGWNSGITGSEALASSLYALNWFNQNQTDMVDIDGDGIIDQVGMWNDNGLHQLANHNLSSSKQDRLKKVTNGFGVSAQISYKPLTDPTVYTKGTGATFPDADVVSPMLVVSQVSNDDGSGGTYDVNYTYTGLRTNADRGSQGFASMTVTDSRTNITSLTTFKQAFPFTGMTYTTTTRSGSVALSDSIVQYTDKTSYGGKVHFVLATDTVATTRDLNSGAQLTQTHTYVPDPTNDVDAYGNTKRLVVDSGGGFVKTTVSTFTNNTSSWMLGRLTTSTVTSSAPGKPDIVRTSAFAYDPTSGLLTDEAVEPVLSNGQLYSDYNTLAGYGVNSLRTHYEYDAFGNKTAARVCGLKVQVATDGTVSSTNVLEVRSTTSAYDANGRFPSSSTNALGHTETYNAYDQVLGVATQITGPNNRATSWTFDGFGRKTRETRADGTVTDIRRKWAGIGTAVPTGAKIQIETESTGSAPALEFSDAFGRSIRALAINGAGEMVYQDTQYDSMGRAYRKSNPYRNDGTTIYWTETISFDVLNRPLTTRTPSEDGFVETTFGYNGYVTSATDPKSHRTETTRDAQGRVTEVVRNAGAGTGANDYTAVSYDYDAIGEVTQTIAAGVATTVAYDVVGRKQSMTDPDMGFWQYRYNPFGELVWQKDAKNQIVTMTYDKLGRMLTRTETEGMSSWVYDTAWIGKIGSVTAPGGYAESYSYDGYGRPTNVNRTIDGTLYSVGVGYDSVGRPQRTTYPTGFQTINIYNAFGALKEIRRSDSGRSDLYWMAEHYAVDGKIDGEVYGNGIGNDRVYSPATGRLTYAAIDIARVTSNYAIQDLHYTYDGVGNVHTRIDGPTNRSETFEYDGLDRLTDYSLTGAESTAAHVDYDQKGNITNKTGLNGLGGYAYNYTPAGRTNALPHAVSQAGANSYGYDANGNMTSGAGRAITWTSFNQALMITQGSYSSSFTFDAAHQRVKQTSHLGTTIYVGGLFERFTNTTNGTTIVENKHYIIGPSGRVAVHTERSDASIEDRYFHSDGLGSITAVTDEYGFVVQRFAFDAWGKRLNVKLDDLSTASATSTNNGGFTRGFTDHEQLDDLGLVHMNGRVYDPVLGRFLSADPNIDGVSDAQGYNRYSYVGNNPLGATDPTGYIKFGEVVKIAAVVAIAVVAAVYLGPVLGQFIASGLQAMGISTLAFEGVISGFAGGLAGGFASGFAGSLLNGGSVGDAFRAGAIGAATGAATGALAGGIGDILGHDIGSFGREFGRALAHGAANGLVEDASGGEFRHGFYAGVVGSAAGSFTDGRIEGDSWDRVAERTAVAAISGGTAAVVGGGKFTNGAVSATFQHLFNAEASRFKRGTKNPNLPPEVDKIYHRIIHDIVWFPGKPVALSGEEFDAIMAYDAQKARNYGYEKETLPLFLEDIRYSGGDGFFHLFADAQFSLGGRTFFGGDINYYYQGMVSAARGWESPDHRLIDLYNEYGRHGVPRPPEAVAGLHRWAEKGYNFYILKYGAPK